MNAFRRLTHSAACTALVLGTGLGLSGTAAGSTVGTVTADTSNCTTNNVQKAANQASTPWEIANVGLGNNAQSTLVDSAGQQQFGDGVKVAVIDTGIAQSSQLPVVGGKVFNGENGFASDDDGHGTMVASIIGAHKSSANGMQGLAPGVQLLSLREAGCQATAGNDEKTMGQAINEAVSENADVINISQDGYSFDPTLHDALVNAYQHGVVVVTSAGNQGDRDTTDSNTNHDYGVNPVTYPAMYSTQGWDLAVGAVDQYSSVPTFSETNNAKAEQAAGIGPYLSVVAPGVGIGALIPPNGQIATDDGTSFAAPYVAAEAALLISEHNWQNDDTSARAYEVMKIIEATSDGGGAYSSSRGWGEVDIAKALQVSVPNQLTGSGSIQGLTPLLGAGPLADGTAATNQASTVVVKPFTGDAADQEAQRQQKWAYIALAVGLLAGVVTLAGAAVYRDAARRRGVAKL